MIISSAEKLFLEMMMWDVSGRRANGDLSPTGNQWNQLKLKLKSYIIFLKCRHYLTLFLRVLDINVQKLFSQLLSERGLGMLVGVQMEMSPTGNQWNQLMATAGSSPSPL